MISNNTKVVLSVGGSILYPSSGPNVEKAKSIAKLLSKYVEQGYSFGILVGGGVPARTYANAVRELGGSEFDADSVAIISTRQNASLLRIALGNLAYPKVITSFDDAKSASVNHKIIVMGGTIPGITTDTDAVLLAESIGANRIVNISNINGIYDSDPKINKNAKKFDSLSYSQLSELANKADMRNAGTNFVFDLLACRLIARSKIETHFVSSNINDIGNAIEGKNHKGTVVK